jgi:TatD related DNase
MCNSAVMQLRSTGLALLQISTRACCLRLQSTPSLQYTRLQSTIASATPASTTAFVDVHCHLVHPEFETEVDEVVQRAAASGLQHCVVNGLDPANNRATLQLCERYPGLLLPACGIYPLDAACHYLKAEMFEEGTEVPEK